MSTDPHVGALWNFDEGYGVYVYDKIQGIRMTSSHICSTTIRVPSMELEIVASVSSANLDVAINMESVIACGLAQSDSDLYGAVTSCSVLTAEGVGLCERDTPGGLPEVPTEAPVTEQTPTDELTTQAPITDDDDDTMILVMIPEALVLSLVQRLAVTAAMVATPITLVSMV